MLSSLLSSHLLLASAIEAPDIDRVNSESGLVALPCGVPLAFSIVECINGVRILVGPRLSTLAIREVSVGTTDGEIQNKVELSVERSSVVLTDPGVVEFLWEFAALEEALLGEIDLEDFLAFVVNVSVEFVLVPVKSVDVEIIIEALVVNIFLVSKLVSVLIPVGAPVES